MSGFLTKAFPTTRRPPLSCRISLLRAFQRGKGCKPPAPNPNPCSLQCPGLRCLSTTLGALSVELEPGQQTPPFHITFPPRGIQRRDPSPQSWGEILIHFEKSLAPRIGGQSTGLAFLLGYASLLSASRTTIRVQILQLSHPQADPALSQGSRGRREWGYFRGAPPPGRHSQSLVRSHPLGQGRRQATDFTSDTPFTPPPHHTAPSSSWTKGRDPTDRKGYFGAPHVPSPPWRNQAG